MGDKLFKDKLGTIIDGIAASEHIDTSGEILSIEGMDISSLGAADSVLNWEHGSKENPTQIVGKITFAKKIFKKDDCKTDREIHFWKKSEKPFVYIKAELFDHPDVGHRGAQELAALLRYENRHKGDIARNLVSLSIEGGKLEKKGMVVTKSLGRDVAATIKHANAVCICEILEDVKDRSDLYKAEIELADLKKADYFAGLYQAKTGKTAFKEKKDFTPLNPQAGKQGARTGKEIYNDPKTWTSKPQQPATPKIQPTNKPKTGYNIYNDPATWAPGANQKPAPSIASTKGSIKTTAGQSGIPGSELYNRPDTFKEQSATPKKSLTPKQGIKTSSSGIPGKQLYSSKDFWKNEDNNVRKALIAGSGDVVPSAAGSKLSKNEDNGGGDQGHPITRIPHIMFSAENPVYPQERQASHEEVLSELQNQGLKAHEIAGQYGGKKERSIIVLNPPKEKHFAIHKIAQMLGQESSIHSDGKNHKLIYLNGPDKGSVVHGSGSVFHSEQPSDNYTTLPDGTHFSHNFDFDQKKRPENDGLDKSEIESLKKGSLQSKLKFNPKKDIDPRERIAVEGWQSGIKDRYNSKVSVFPRHNIPEMSEEVKTRALNKLHRATEVRRHPKTGERMFLLHRGGSENPDVHSKNTTSWTPNFHQAKDFAGDSQGTVYSAWVPESQIKHIPKSIGSSQRIMDDDSPEEAKDNAFFLREDLKNKPEEVAIGKNPFAHEHEVIVNPHKMIYAAKRPKTLKEKVHSKLNKSQKTLTHYSPQQLQTVDPAKQGTSVDIKRKKPTKESWFYEEGGEPESIVASGAKFKHKVELPQDARIYDIAKDDGGIYEGLKQKAMKRDINPGIVRSEDLIQAIKDSGYHGYKHSQHPSPEMRGAVALFHQMPVKESRPIQPEDFKTTSWQTKVK